MLYTVISISFRYANAPTIYIHFYKAMTAPTIATIMLAATLPAAPVGTPVG
jgi:hypothetical protein